MRPLATNQRVLTWLYLYPIDNETSKWKQRAHVAVGITAFITIGVIFIAGAVYVRQFITIDLQEALFALIHVALTIDSLSAIVILFLARDQIKMVFEHLSDIYNKSNYQRQNFC